MTHEPECCRVKKNIHKTPLHLDENTAMGHIRKTKKDHVKNYDIWREASCKHRTNDTLNQTKMTDMVWPRVKKEENITKNNAKYAGAGKEKVQEKMAR